MTEIPKIPERKLELVRKLLAVAEHPNTSETEAAIYLERACGIMAAYGIEQAMLADAGKVADEVGCVTIRVGNPYQPDRRTLLAGVAAALRCQSIYRKIGQVSEVQVVGYESDLALVEMLFTSLCLQMASGVLRVAAPPGHTTISYRKSWMAGYVNRVCERLRAAERRAAQEAEPVTGRSTDLVLLDRRAEVSRVYQQMFPQVRRAGRRALSDWSGWSSGRAAGDRADLGGTRLGARSRSALGS
ncbi:DUF2786 domain-containing protein [Planotetraspora sp. GP83]|uniref:DUF2786 domain-containing protein n=1 Tax=Planotetraspora sp. GP83 TaxID=3156264 RepID=UPI0035125AAA